MLSLLWFNPHCTIEETEARRQVTCLRSGSPVFFLIGSFSSPTGTFISLNSPSPYSKHTGRYFIPIIFILFYYNTTFHFLKPCLFPPQHSILGMFYFLLSYQMTLRYLVLRQHLAPTGLESCCFFSLVVHSPLCLFIFFPLPLSFSSISTFFLPSPLHFFS